MEDQEDVLVDEANDRCRGRCRGRRRGCSRSRKARAARLAARRAARKKRYAKKMKALWKPLKDTKAGKMIARCAGDDYVLKWDELKACLKKAGKNPDDIEKAHEIWIKGVETHNLNR